jgi:anti-anti-sigma factor
MAESPSTPLDIRVERAESGSETTVLVRGEVDLDSSEQLRRALEDAVAAAAQPGASTRLHLDLADVDYMDSTGLRAVLQTRDELDEQGGTLDVVAVSAIVRRLIEITGMSELLAPEET